MTMLDFGMEIMTHPRAVALQSSTPPSSPRGVAPVAALGYASRLLHGRAAYGFSAKKDCHVQHLVLNQQVAAKIESGEPVTVPGIPRNYPDPKKLVTEDCIRPAEGNA